jgi:Fe-S cluster biogenesis protein NfuA
MTHQQRILKRSLNLKYIRDEFPSDSPFWLDFFSYQDHHYELFFQFVDGKLSNGLFKLNRGRNPLIEALLDTTIELIHNKSLKQINVLSAREIENSLRDFNDQPVIDDQFLLVELDKMLEKVKNNVYNLARKNAEDPTLDFKEVVFKNLKLVDKILAVEAVLDRFIRPTLLLDQGDIELLEIEDLTFILSFQGACGTCPSSSAGTLDFVLRTLKSELNEGSITIVLDK